VGEGRGVCVCVWGVCICVHGGCMGEGGAHKGSRGVSRWIGMCRVSGWGCVEGVGVCVSLQCTYLGPPVNSARLDLYHPNTSLQWRQTWITHYWNKHDGHVDRNLYYIT
jgi:hypothetical protein